MDKYAAALPGCPRLGAKRMRGLIEFFHTAEDVWKASDEDIRKSHVLHGNGEAAFLAWRHETNPDAVMEKLIQNHIRCCTWEEEDYPALLRTTANPPAVLFYRGKLPDHEKLIAIVGSRKATAYGVQTAGRFARGLAEEGITVVSGGARGIDSASHEGALAGRAPTIVVAAFGLDRVGRRHYF